MKRLWIGRYGISFRFSWRCSYVGFSWDKGTLWIMPLPFCALSIEFPQRIKYTHGGYVKGKTLAAKLECGNDHVCFPMRESDFNIRVRPLVAESGSVTIEDIKKEFEKPNKDVKITPYYEIDHIFSPHQKHPDMCGLCGLYKDVHYARKENEDAMP